MSDQPKHRESQAKRAQRYFRRLRESVALEYCVEACQPVHSRYSECRQCERSCPVNALHVGDGGVQVDDSCLGCGQCAVACPTGALGTPGFALPAIEWTVNDPVFIDCWKVPAAHSPKHAVRVPCLGGIALSRLIELRVMAGLRPIVMLDRGWCASCKFGQIASGSAMR
jgi:Fe-S-cluster-containing hydrogenase component 2